MNNHLHQSSSHEFCLVRIAAVCLFGQNEREGEGSEKNIELKILYLDCTEIENKSIPDTCHQLWIVDFLLPIFPKFTEIS